MKGWPLWATATAAAAIVMGFGLYLARGGEGQQVIPDRPEPKVAGRLMSTYIGEGDNGGIVGECEFDARVLLEAGRVVQILEHGDRPPVRVGDRVANPLVDPSEPGGSASTARLDLLGVYWGSDGRLYAGCAPESVIYQGGKEIPIKGIVPAGPSE